MRITSAGVISWIPGVTQVGSHDVAITVSDGLGAGTQTYAVVVPGDDADANRAPVIASTPNFTAEVGSLYQYEVAASDPDGDTLTYEVLGKPDGMEIDSNGLITFTPTAAGEHALVVQVQDPEGATATQGYQLSVTVNQSPNITAIPDNSVTAGAKFRYTRLARIESRSRPSTLAIPTGC